MTATRARLLRSRADLLDSLLVEQHQPVPAPAPWPVPTAREIERLVQAMDAPRPVTTDPKVVAYVRVLLQRGRSHRKVAELCDLTVPEVSRIDRAGW